MHAVDSTFLLEIVGISVDTMCCILHVQVTLIHADLESQSQRFGFTDLFISQFFSGKHTHNHIHVPVYTHMQAFGFITIFIYIALAVWMVFFIVFKWNKYSTSTGNSKAAATPA